MVGWTAGLLHGDDEVAGFLTSGGTESILCGVLAARERGRIERGITEPEIVLRRVGARGVPQGGAQLRPHRSQGTGAADWTADVEAMAALCGPNTVLVVGSAPQYPQGVQDDIPAIAALAASIGANCHVDACMGGFVLPFVEMLGREVKPWDFRVDGVTSISADIHKLGLRAQGCVGDPAPHQGVPQVPDVRVRRLARWVLRLAEHAGHPLRTPDGVCVGGDVAPRHRRVSRSHAADAGQRRRVPGRRGGDRRHPGAR